MEVVSVLPSSQLLTPQSVQEMDAITVNINKLMKSCRIMEVPIVVTEQYPKALGNTIAELDTAGCTVLEKTRFSMVPEDQSLSTWGDGGLCDSFVLMGLEAHVCVQQTALDLLAMGKQVYLAVDCITSQRALDRETAVERLKQAGAMVTTSESVMFELMRAKEHPHFKALQATPSQLCLLPIMCRRPALPSPPACCGVHPILIPLPLPRGSSRSSRRRRCGAPSARANDAEFSL